MERINIEEKNIFFKQIVSGPAPVGRILNYIKLIGRGVLKHKSGHRTTNLVDNIGYAWTIEFMIGLGLTTLGRKADKGTYLNLTDSGMKIYQVIKNLAVNFDESQDVRKVKREVEINCVSLIPIFENVFRESVVFKILKEYLNENGYEYNNRVQFLNDYFETLKMMYDESTESGYYRKENRSTELSTGGNRVPSLIQMCQFFNYVIDSNGLYFVREQFLKDNFSVIDDKVYSEEELKKAQDKENKIIQEIENLEEKYGVDGNVLIQAIVRNSTVQKMFRNNLIHEYGSKCMVCGIENQELLIASHIKPASESDVHDKVNNNNGLLLCANHDKLFDRYLMTFDCFTGLIKISDKLSETDKIKLGINDTVKLDENILNEERIGFLALHNIEFHNENGGNN